MQEYDWLTGTSLDVMPRKILRVAGCRNKVMRKGDSVDNLGVALLITFTGFDMSEMLGALFDALFVGNRALDSLAATFRYLGVLMRTLEGFGRHVFLP
jgi:hypothetical protein